MEFSSGNHFSEFLHVYRLDIDNVETLVRDIQVPEVDSQVISRDISLSIRVDRYRINMVGMCVLIGLARYSSSNGIMVNKCWQLDGCLESGGSGSVA